MATVGEILVPDGQQGCPAPASPSLIGMIPGLSGRGHRVLVTPDGLRPREVIRGELRDDDAFTRFFIS